MTDPDAPRRRLNDAYAEGNIDTVKKYLRQIRAQELWKGWGFASFHKWVTAECPVSVSKSYLWSKAPEPTPDPLPEAPPEEPPPPELDTQEFDQLTEVLSTLRTRLAAVAVSPSGLALATHSRMDIIIGHLNGIQGLLDRCRPHHVCPYCRDQIPAGTCRACSSRGWMTKEEWDLAMRGPEP